MSEESREKEAGQDDLTVGGRRAWLLQALGAAVALGAAGASISCAKKEEPTGGTPDGTNGGTADTSGGAGDTTGGANGGAAVVTSEKTWCVEDLDFDENGNLYIKDRVLADLIERAHFDTTKDFDIVKDSLTHPGQKVNVIC